MPDDDFVVLSFKRSKAIQEDHVRIGLSYDSDEQIRQQLFTLTKFLQDKSLTTAILVRAVADVGANFELRWSHLTEGGKSFSRKVMKKWTAARNKKPLNVLNKTYDVWASEQKA